MGLAFWRRKPEESRDIYPLSIDEWANFFSFAGNMYPLGLNQTLTGTEVQVEASFPGYVRDAYKSNGIVFACMLVRMLLFSEARFAYRELKDGRPGDLHSGGTDARSPANRDLAMLMQPWPNGTTGDMLSRMIQDADLAGNSYDARDGQTIHRLRPDWVTIVLGGNATVWDAKIVGYLYHPGGKGSGSEPKTFDVSQVAHFAPIPDPMAPYRGMSWLTPVIREISADVAMMEHKRKFFQQGATVNLVVKTNQTTKEAFDRWVDLFREKHESVANAYKTLFLAAGQDATPVGSTLQQADFKVVQGSGETRIAAASGVPPILVGLSEGLASATYSNYASARRRFADGTLRPLWRNAAASVATIVAVPSGSELWYDDRDIPFLHEDALDANSIRQTQAASIRILIDAGFEPDSVVASIITGDMSRLKHMGLPSVQLQPQGSGGLGIYKPEAPLEPSLPAKNGGK